MFVPSYTRFLRPAENTIPHNTIFHSQYYYEYDRPPRVYPVTLRTFRVGDLFPNDTSSARARIAIILIQYTWWVLYEMRLRKDDSFEN